MFLSRLVVLVGILSLPALNALGAVKPSLHGPFRGCCPRSPENPSLVLASLSTVGISWKYLRAKKSM